VIFFNQYKYKFPIFTLWCKITSCLSQFSLAYTLSNDIFVTSVHNRVIYLILWNITGTGRKQKSKFKGELWIYLCNTEYTIFLPKHKISKLCSLIVYNTLISFTFANSYATGCFHARRSLSRVMIDVVKVSI